VFTYNQLDLKRTRWEGSDELSPGKHTIVFDLRYDGLGFATLALNNLSGIGRSATGTLTVDGKVVATQKMAKTIALSLDEYYQFEDRLACGRLRLSNPIPVHRQTQQADDLRRTAEADAGRRVEAVGGPARLSGGEVTGKVARRGVHNMSMSNGALLKLPTRLRCLGE
jgi:hypothetical protein